MEKNDNLEIIDLGDKQNPKKSKKGLIITLCLILAVVVLIVVAYFMLLSPTKIITSLTDNFEKDLKTLVTQTDEKVTSLLYQGDVTLKKAPSAFELYNGTKIDYKFGYDTINKKILADLNLNLAGTQMPLQYLLQDGMSYINAPGFLPVMTKIDTKEFTDMIFTESSEELKLDNLINAINSGFKKSRDDKKLKTSLVFGEKNAAAIAAKTTYNLDAKEFNNVKNGIIDAILNNDKAVEELSTLLSQTTEETKSSLNMEKSENVESGNLTAVIYTDLFGKKLYKMQMFDENDKFTIINNSKELIANLTSYENNELMGQLDFTINKKDSSFNFTMKTNDESLKEISAVSTITEIDDKNAKGNLTMKIVTNLEGKDEEFEISVNLEAKIDQSFDSFDTSKAKTFEEYTEAELNSFMQTMEGIGELFPTGSTSF